MPRSSIPSNNILYIGIDLGTSRSAIAASNGKRRWIHSYVGWPRDFVARRMLKQDVLIGRDAIEHRNSVNLVRPLEHGVIKDGADKDEKAVRELVSHLIDLVQPEEGQKIYAAVGVPAEALRINKLAIRNAIGEWADTLMLVSEPFAVAYRLGALNNTCIIDIGAGTVDFCVMHGTVPGEEDQRSLRTGGDHVDEQLLNLLSERFVQTPFSVTFARELKEKYGSVSGASDRIKVRLPIAGKFEVHDLTEEVWRSCESMIPSISETLIDLLSSYEPMLQERIRHNIYLAGGGSQIHGLAKAISFALEEYGQFTITPIQDPLFSGAEGALNLAEDMPQEYWENM
ncbi:MAG: rod shape-determining protein [Bacteroidetes bacterium]|nr:rod shape-determining protein [Bacteroidota bacterium]MCY4205222.1 rod shape-determining protein [Bacteroidota bacterium]